MKLKSTKYVMLCLFLLLSTNVFADGIYTVEFQDTGSSNDGNTEKNSTTDIIKNGSDFMTVSSASHIYLGKFGYGIKGGDGSNAGTITLNTTATGKVKPTKIVIKAALYGSDTRDLNVSINGGTASALGVFSTIEYDYEVSMNGNTELSSITLTASEANNARFYIKSIKVYYLAVPVTITSAGRATYASEYDLDFTNVEGLKAYVCTGLTENTNNLVMEEVKIVQKEKGLYLAGAEGVYYVPIYTGNSFSSTSGDNYLIGNLQGLRQINNNNTNVTKYILQNGKNGLKFYKVRKAGNTIANKRAYLRLPIAQTSAKEWLDIENEATSIGRVDEVNAEVNANVVYNISGRKMSAWTKGIIIIDGKKYLNK